MTDDNNETGDPEITVEMIEAGVDALFASGLIEWNRPRLVARGVVEDILWAALSAAHSPTKTRAESETDPQN